MASANPPSASDGVRVCIRVRPLNNREKLAAAECKSSWAISNTTITQCIQDKPIAANSFAFDHVFEQMVNNEHVYNALAKPVVTSATDGINGVIFAYGQTAAGKTYTMLGTEGDPGVTRRSIAEVFHLIASCTNRQFLLRASYIEIYNEIIRDLLQPDNDNLKIHEDVFNKRVFVDSREEVVTSVAQVMDIIARGETARAVGETNMNERSSRSHTIFSLKIESRELTPQEEHGEEPPPDDGVAVRASTLSLVDLAGSERASFTKAQGMRLVEGGHINKSLLTLGNVINKLSTGEAGSIAHIPYRDSKLTRLLQPALGGNARTAIVCAVTPAVLHMEETLSTLKFASRAKKVTNHAKTNEFLDDRAKLRKAEKELAALRAENDKLKSGIVPVFDGSVGRVSKQGADARLVAFGKKFDLLIKQIKAPNADPAIAPSPSESLSWSKSQSSNLVSALITVESLKSTRRSALSVGDSAEACGLRTKVLVAEKRALEAERRERQAIAEIRYERQAMMAEVEALVSTCEEVEAARCEAERECARANSALTGSITGSLVNDVVTEAVVRAEVRGEVREMGEKLGEMERVKEKNMELRKRLGELEKEHAEVVKREKRGVGPALREVKVLQGKLGEAEKKWKALRQTSNKLGSEKAAAERQLKEVIRKNKVLTGEIEKHRGHQSKGQDRMNKQLAEERKRFEASGKEMKEEMAVLRAKVKEAESEAQELSRAVCQLEGEVTEISAERDTMKDAKSELSTENIELNDKLKKAEAESVESKEEIKRLEEANERHGKEVQKLAEISAERDTLKDAKKELSAEKEELRNKLKKAEEGRAESKEEIKRLEDANESHGKELQKLAEICAERDSLKDAKRELSAVKEELTDKLKKAEKENAQSIEEIKRLEDENEKHGKEAQRLGEISAERDTLKDAKKELSAEKEELQDKLKKAEEERAESKEEIKRLGDVIERHGKEVQELEEELGKCQLEMEECRSELEAVTEKLREAEGKAQGLSATVQESKIRIQELEAIEQRLEVAIKEEQSGRGVAEGQVKDVRGELKRQLEATEAMKSKIESYEAALQKRDCELREAGETVEELEGRIKEMETMRREIAEHDNEERVKLQNSLERKRETDERKMKELEEEWMGEVEKLRAELQGVKKERGKLEYDVEKLMTETATRTREVLKLSEAIQARDRKIYGLQDRLEEIGRGEGVVGKLEERCRRRELMIGELNRRLELVQEAADRGSIGDELRDRERMVYLESKNAALLVEHGHFQVRLARMEKEKEAVVEEGRRLKERLKDRDLRRVREAAEQKEADLEEMTRKRGGLKEVNMNTGTAATRSCGSN